MFLMLTAENSKLPIQKWSFWWPSLSLQLCRFLPRVASSWQTHSYHPSLPTFQKFSGSFLRSSKEDQTSFSDVTWDTWGFLRWDDVPRATQPAGGLRDVTSGLLAFGMHAHLLLCFLLYPRDWKCQCYFPIIVVIENPYVSQIQPPRCTCCLLQDLEGRKVIISASVVTDGWAVADTQLYVKKQVLPYLWVGLWPCDLETRLPVAAPSLPFLWLFMVLQALNLCLEDTCADVVMEGLCVKAWNGKQHKCP